MSFTQDASFERESVSTPIDRHNTLNKLFPSRTENKSKSGSIDDGLKLAYNPNKERRKSFVLPTDISPTVVKKPKEARRRSSVAPFINNKGEVNAMNSVKDQVYTPHHPLSSPFLQFICIYLVL